MFANCTFMITDQCCLGIRTLHAVTINNGVCKYRVRFRSDGVVMCQYITLGVF